MFDRLEDLLDSLWKRCISELQEPSMWRVIRNRFRKLMKEQSGTDSNCRGI